MSHWPADLVDAIDSRILTLLADVTPYRAIVTEVAASGMVKLRRAEATTASTELYARVAGFVVAVDDEVVCLEIAGRAVVVGILQYAARTGYALDAPLTLADSDHTHPLRLGDYRLWVDSSGRLRIKSGAPSGDTDGTVVGTQS